MELWSDGMMKKKILLAIFLTSYLPIFLTSMLLSSPLPASDGSGHYLLMQPIEDAVRSGDFSYFKGISQGKISVNFEAPFGLTGYIFIDKFVEDFTGAYALYKAERLEWSSKQIDGNFAVQSLNVILKHTRSEKELYYKFIFFMKKKAKWKIYYLRGLKI
jgi:hypothetical protein